jgi:hypothetical protein
LANVSKFNPSPLARDKILISMLKLPTHSGFHDLFLKHTSFTQMFEQNYYLYSTYTKVKKQKKTKKTVPSCIRNSIKHSFLSCKYFPDRSNILMESLTFSKLMCFLLLIPKGNLLLRQFTQEHISWINSYCLT